MERHLMVKLAALIVESKTVGELKADIQKALYKKDDDELHLACLFFMTKKSQENTGKGAQGMFEAVDEQEQKDKLFQHFKQNS